MRKFIVLIVPLFISFSAYFLYLFYQLKKKEPPHEQYLPLFKNIKTLDPQDNWRWFLAFALILMVFSLYFFLEEKEQVPNQYQSPIYSQPIE